MKLVYVPLLQLQRGLHDLPRGRERFARYRSFLNPAAGESFYPPLLIVNPMAREPVAARLDEWLALEGEEQGQQATEALTDVAENVPGEDLKIALVLADDTGGGWTNRYTWEFFRRFERPPEASRGWVSGVLWTSETPRPGMVRKAVQMAVLREIYVRRHGAALTLGKRMAQEGAVMAGAGCTVPALDPSEIDYAREILDLYLDTTDLPTALTCLFGDPAARSLGYEPVGLSRWAGLALALHDARMESVDMSLKIER